VDLREIMAALLYRWALLVLVPAAAAGAAVAISVTGDPVYESTTTLAVRVAPSEGQVPRTEDIRVAFQLTETYARLLTADPVLAELAERLDPTDGSDLHNDIDASTDPETQLIELSARAGTREGAEALAAGAAAVAQQRARALRVGGQLVVIEPPTSAEQVAPDLVSNLAIALAIGVTVALILALLLEAGAPIRSSEELSSLVGLDVLGSIRNMPRRGPDQLSRAALSGVLDDYMLVRAQLELAMRDKPSATVLLTGLHRNAGTSTTAANLALVFAKGAARVLLVDADLRSPTQHAMFGVPGGAGLATALAGDTDPAALVQHVNDNLAILPAGSPPNFPADLITRAGDVLDELRGGFDLTLVDGPALRGVADSLLLAQRSQAVVLVVDAKRTKSASVVAARKTLEATGTPVVGIVLNRIGARRWLSPLQRRTIQVDRATTEAERVP
jgi:succinoglycan biosynthesis transport protein ExoP